ncbi:hypothetical protein FVEN_g4086 [Fusarium venenatum]|uniref:Zn(2)-C6 fungal-type domain-containing protein n=1 Tax=Fusarium venenatum TaxID=56646 RepID=A0A2L2TLR7_9HYPO|nr:uncharacterized protein FVRRES_09230 [Fusarium venenatum]KAG8358207.1 hypothetical protein FVEN_g4086 [Fusarium venenatum]KAH6965925.1 hypothetical protein EDB82DRAFT_316835 [Fusarium venenatum]CEI69153.1 unnamed protein product [Fusarium venenatum]
MSPSSTGESAHSISINSARPFTVPTRDSFSLELPMSSLATMSADASLKSPISYKNQRTPSFSRDAMMGTSQKARHLSQSSDNNRPDNMSNGGQKVSSDEGSNPLKRRNTETGVDYPRRRATIACEVCRSRKSRCDGTKPKCKLCTELGAECIYREPGIKLDAGDKLILERLNRIESLLQMSMVNTTANGLGLTENSPGMSNGTGLDGDNMLLSANAATFSSIPNGGFGTWSAQPVGTNISTMPKVHTNAAMHLLQWPLIRDLISRQCDPQVLLQLEMAREPLHTLTKTPCVDLSNTQAYIEAYFERVNVWYACVNPYTWRSQYRTALSNGFREGPESCIVLLVLALGQASLHGSISRILPHEDPPGLQYFTAAWSLLPGLMTANSVVAAQCHLLAAAYHFYLVRPMEAWNLLCTTSTKLQLLLMAPSRIPSHQRELVERIYWNALLFESDLLAELDLPHSGVVQFEEHVGLPGGFEGDESEQVGRDELWYFLAEIALRRLLNRVSHLIYSKDSIANTQSLDPVVAELDYQLSQWYESLPLPLQFPFTRNALQDPVQTVLRLRFFACRTIIYRPYILAVLDNEQQVLDPAVRENCHKCLEASLRQLEHIHEHHAGHMPYIWQGALSMVSQTLLIMGATMSPSLLNILLTLVPSREALDQIINDVVMEVERYATLAPSLSLASEMLKEAEVRRRAFLGTP